MRQPDRNDPLVEMPTSELEELRYRLVDLKGTASERSETIERCDLWIGRITRELVNRELERFRSGIRTIWHDR